MRRAKGDEKSKKTYLNLRLGWKDSAASVKFSLKNARAERLAALLDSPCLASSAPWLYAAAANTGGSDGDGRGERRPERG